MSTAKFMPKVNVALVASIVGLGAVNELPAADKSYDKSTAAPASNATTQQGTTARARDASFVHDLRASKTIGMKVRNAQNESLGKIDDLVIDVNNERVSYAVLSFDGTVGLGGDKLFAYPLSVFKPSATRNDELVLNVDKEKLRGAPGFESKQWPDWNQARYRGDVDKYFGPTVSAKTMPNQRLVRASDLIGKNVDDRNGKHAGEIEDLVVNLDSSTVHYAVLDFDKKWSMDDKMLPLPLRSFTFPGDFKKDAVLNVAREGLDMSYAFDDGKWPDIGDSTYRTNIDSYLRNAPGSRPAAGQAGPMRRDYE